jgi:hypothetical protein
LESIKAKQQHLTGSQRKSHKNSNIQMKRVTFVLSAVAHFWTIHPTNHKQNCDPGVRPIEFRKKMAFRQQCKQSEGLAIFPLILLRDVKYADPRLFV